MPRINRFILIVFVFTLLYGVGGIFLAPSSAHAAASQAYSIQFVDTATGHVSTWSTTSYSAWQARLNHERAIRQQVAPTSHPSPNITRVGCSNFNNSFYDLRNVGPPVCFANAGDTGSINVFCVFEVDTGNNTGHFTVNNGVGAVFTVNTPIRFHASFALSNPTGHCAANEFFDIIDVHIN